MMNIDLDYTVKTYIFKKCVSFADMYCVLRPTASLFNPNTLGTYFILMTIGLTGFNLIENKLCVASILIFSLTAICLFLTGSRSLLLILIIFHFFLIIFQLFYSPQYIIKTLITSGIFYCSFLMMIVIGKFRLFNASPTYVLELLYDRWSFLPVQLVDIIIGIYRTLLSKVQTDPLLQLSSYTGRFSSYSTDNTYIMILRDEGILSFLILVGILLFFAFSCLELYLRVKKIDYLFYFCSVISLSLIFAILNIFANFPIFIFCSIFFSVLFFILEKEKRTFLFRK